MIPVRIIREPTGRQRKAGRAGVALVLWLAVLSSTAGMAAAQEDGLLFDNGPPMMNDGASGDPSLDDGTLPSKPERRPAGAEMASAPGAELRGLDKVTGQTTDLEIRDGQSVRFGRLNVAVTDCRYPVADQSSNAFAHVVITEADVTKPIFDAWMVASSPALSALDHPRYDVWVMRCMSK